MANQNPTIQTQFAFADPNASPLTINDFIALLNTLVTSQLAPEDSFAPYIISADTPSTDQGDFVWIKLDSSGNPISTNILVGGVWRRVYNGMTGEIRGFKGVPGYNTTGNFDATGLGNPPGGSGGSAGEYDGWAICNGNNGTEDMSNRFVVGADLKHGTTFGGYDASLGWQTRVANAAGDPNPDPDALSHTGGAWTEVLQPKHIPLPLLVPTVMSRWTVGGASGVTIPPSSSGVLWGLPDSGSTMHNIPGTGYPGAGDNYPPAGYAGNDPAQHKATPIQPPYYAFAWIQFIGY